MERKKHRKLPSIEGQAAGRQHRPKMSEVKLDAIDAVSVQSSSISHFFQSQASLSSLEFHLEKLLKKRIALLLKQNRDPKVRLLITKIDQQLQKLRKKILKHQPQLANKEAPQDEWQQLTQKIRLVQQLLSCQLTDAQILKKFYQIFSHRTQYQKLNGNYMPIDHENNKETHIMQKKRLQRIYPREMLQLKTTQQEDYVRPKTNYYVRVPERNQKNKQEDPEPSLTLSSYKIQYPAYVTSNIYHYCPPDEVVKTAENSYANITSQYGRSYKEQPAKQAASKKKKYYFSCHRDNIKNLQLAYRLEKARPSEDMLKKVPQLERLASKRPKEVPNLIHSYQGQYNSTSHLEHSFCQRQPADISQPKDGQLKRYLTQQRALLICQESEA